MACRVRHGWVAVMRVATRKIGQLPGRLAKQMMLLLIACVSVCLSVRAETENMRSEIYAAWWESAVCYGEVITFW